NDRRVFTCIDSLPGGLDIIVLLSTGDPLESELKSRRVRTIVIGENDLGMRCNAAIENAYHDRILLLDSDCIVEPRGLCLVEKALDQHSVARMKLLLRD